MHKLRHSVSVLAARQLRHGHVRALSASALRSAHLPTCRVATGQRLLLSVQSIGASPSTHMPRRWFAASDFPEHEPVKLPALSPTMETGTLMSWLKKEGDEVREGDILCEIQTDKATMAFESPEEGFLAKILVPADTKDVPVGKLICVIALEKDDIPKFADFSGGDVPAPITPPSAPQPAAASPPTPAAPASAPPAAATPAMNFGDLRGVGQPLPQRTTPTPTTPLARNVAAQNNVNLANVGAGPGGMIRAGDVMAAGGAPSGGSPPAMSPMSSTPAAVQVPSGAPYVDLPISQIRSVIAKRLVESKQQVPHYYLSVDIVCDHINKVRTKLNEQLAAQHKDPSTKPLKLSMNDFILKASALACQRVPAVNSQWLAAENVIRQFARCDVSVAVATPDGLITPIVAGVDQKGLLQIAQEVRELAGRARENRLQPEEFQGGTFTVSNLGMFGIDRFTAIINPPQACILAVGQQSKRLAFGGEDSPDKVVEQAIMTVTLSCDHRVVDGAVGAQWLQHFRRLLEKPETMLL